MTRLEKCAIIFVMFAILSNTVIPHIEGKFFPVMGKLTLSNPEPAPPPEYRLRWHGEADKLRNCEPVEVQWFLGSRGGYRVSVTVDFADEPKIRPGKSRQTWDYILISMNRENTMENSHADAVHQCPWRPWQTITPFYN